MAEIEFREALRSALDEELERDERVILFGEDVAIAGGVFAVTPGLYEKYGPTAGLRHADLRAGDDRRRVRRGDHGSAAGARDHVRRLPRPLDGQPDQPGDQVLVPDRAEAGLPAGDPLGRRRGRPLRRDPLADAGVVADGHHRAEDRRAVEPGRREGAAEGRDPRREPRHLLRAQAPLLDQGRRDEQRADRARQREGRPRGLRRHARQRDEGRPRLPGRGRRAGRPRASPPR